MLRHIHLNQTNYCTNCEQWTILSQIIILLSSAANIVTVVDVFVSYKVVFTVRKCLIKCRWAARVPKTWQHWIDKQAAFRLYKWHNKSNSRADRTGYPPWDGSHHRLWPALANLLESMAAGHGATVTPGKHVTTPASKHKSFWLFFICDSWTWSQQAY